MRLDIPARRTGLRFFIVVFILFVRVVGAFLVAIVLFFLLIVFGDHVEVDGMGLEDLEFSIALWTAEDLAFLDFLFVHVDFRVALGTFHHGISSPAAWLSDGSVLYNACVQEYL